MIKLDWSRAVIELVLGILLTVASIQVAGTGAQVTERDVAVFRAVLQDDSLVFDPDISDPMHVRTKPRSDVPAPSVVSPTLRVCHQPVGDIRCVVVNLRAQVEREVITEQEIAALTDANALARSVPSNLILVVTVEQAFLGAREWQDVWHGVDRRKLAECVQFTVPVYGNGAALVYAQRVSRGHAYGWLLKLEDRSGQWRVVTKKMVWDSFPSA